MRARTRSPTEHMPSLGHAVRCRPVERGTRARDSRTCWLPRIARISTRCAVSSSARRPDLEEAVARMAGVGDGVGPDSSNVREEVVPLADSLVGIVDLIHQSVLSRMTYQDRLRGTGRAAGGRQPEAAERRSGGRARRPVLLHAHGSPRTYRLTRSPSRGGGPSRSWTTTAGCCFSRPYQNEVTAFRSRGR